MKEKTITTIFIILGIMIVLAGLHSQGIIRLPLAVSDTFTCPGGTGSISSINNVEYFSNDPQIGGERWLVEFRDLPDSECLVGNFGASEIEDEGKTARNNLAIGLQSSEQTCNYNIQREAEYIRTINLKKITYYSKRTNTPLVYDIGEAQEDCRAEGSVYAMVTEQDYISPFTLYCYYYDQNQFAVGDVDFTKLGFSTKITANILGTTYSETLSNVGLDEDGSPINHKSSFYLGPTDNIFVEFGGLLGTGYRCPTADVKAVQLGNRWKTVNEETYQEYKFSKDNSFENCIQFAQSGQTTFEACRDNYNNLANRALNTEERICYLGSCSNTVDSRVSLTLNRPVEYPSIKMRIKADTLGVFVETGQPEIIKLSSPRFNSETQGYITATVRNTGSGTGAFEVSADCPQPIEVLSIDEGRVSPGESEEFYIPLTASSSSDTRKRCTITATDKQSQLTSTRGVYVDVLGSGSVCSPVGDEVCFGNEVRECEQSGIWETSEKCGEDERCYEGILGARCIGEEATCSNCFSWLLGKVSPGYCAPGQVSSSWYNPVTWLTIGQASQNYICPIVLTILVFIIAIAGLLLYLYYSNSPPKTIMDKVKARIRR